MNILHYALGFPPYRSGGLTKLCVDLMEQQAKEGHIVAMLWPGQMKFINKETKIKEHRSVKIRNQNIQSFEIINPLPVPFDEGIANIEKFVRDVPLKPFKALLEKFQPDVIHVHTLMGLHKSFLEAAREKKIRVVFTVHDFFPVCPKVTMYRHGEICNSIETCEKCGVCNATALSLNKIRVLQSPFYRKIKDLSVVKSLRKRHRDNYLGETTANDSVSPVGTATDYLRLRNHYYSILKLMDMIHYNSSVTKKVYEFVFELPNSCTFGITHSDIKDCRRIRTYSDDKLRIRYLGPQGGAKGFFCSRRHLMNCGVNSKTFA